MARKYRKARRAELEDETRRRITEALVELHGTVGPARTTIQAVAAEAGVQRATVYRHFPDEASMFAACSAHWAQQNPLPDPAAWAAVDDPAERLSTALGELYRFYAAHAEMLFNLFRDVSQVEALRPSMQAFADYADAAVEVLAQWADGARVRAAIAHALAFSTWHSLVRQIGLASGDAIRLMTGMVTSARGQAAG